MPFDPNTATPLTVIKKFDPTTAVPDTSSVAPAESAPSLVEAILPRSHDIALKPATLKSMAATGADLSSLLGRTIVAALSSKKIEDINLDEETKKTFKEQFGEGWDEFKRNLAKTESEKGGVGGFVENVATDPATLPSLAVGGPIGAGVKTALTAGAKVGVTSALAHQAENVAENKKVEPVKAVEEVAVGAAMGPLGLLTKGIVQKVIKAPKEIAEGILSSYLKPPLKIYRDGFDVKNIDKYDLYGNTKEIGSKAQGAINERMDQIKVKLSEAGSSGEKIDLADSVIEAIDEIESQKEKFPKLFIAAKNEETPLRVASEKIIGMMSRLANGADEDPLLANQIRQGLGEIAADAFGKYTKEDDALEAVAMITYRKLREQIEQKSPEGIRQLNKEISELIPIKNAAIRRTPIAERQDLISLKDAVSIAGALATNNPAPLLVKVADVTLKNTKFAKVLNRIGKQEELMRKAGSGAYKTVKKPAGQAIRTGLFRDVDYEDNE